MHLLNWLNNPSYRNECHQMDSVKLKEVFFKCSKTIISGDFQIIMLVGGNKWPSLWMSLNEWVTDSLTQSLLSTTLIHSGIKQWLPLWVNSLHLSWNRIDLFKNMNSFMNKTSDCVYKWINESFPQQNQFVSESNHRIKSHTFGEELITW